MFSVKTVIVIIMKLSGRHCHHVIKFAMHAAMGSGQGVLCLAPLVQFGL